MEHPPTPFTRGIINCHSERSEDELLSEARNLGNTHVNAFEILPPFGRLDDKTELKNN